MKFQLFNSRQEALEFLALVTEGYIGFDREGWYVEYYE